MSGAETLRAMLVAFVLLVLAGVVAAHLSAPPRDATDPPNVRSGMAMRTDAATGCQYLTAGFGGLTPRLDGQGRQMGCRR